MIGVKLIVRDGLHYSPKSHAQCFREMYKQKTICDFPIIILMSLANNRKKGHTYASC